MPDTTRPATGLRRLRKLALVALVTLVVLELATRFVLTRPPWSRPFWCAPRHIFHAEIAEVEQAAPRRPGDVEVLLLGGSVLDPRWSQVGARLERRLQQAFDQRGGEPPAHVRVFDLARAGQTTLDSVYKYRWLADYHFDLVIVYDAINDVRFNDCPPELFRDDYGQSIWFRVLASMQPPLDQPLARPSDGWLTFPAALRYAGLLVAERAGWIATLPPERPRAEWLDYGADLKTVATYRRNLEDILAIAAARAEPVLLPVFATYLDRWTESTPPRMPQSQLALELWGRPLNVLAGIEAHNEVLRELAAGRPGVTLVDLSPLAVARDEVFRDICHLTPAGSEAFVELLLPDALRALASTRP
jgi:hypothetical protein